ncbi:MAG: hypothetical protein RLZZ127_69, partial [Planctomycetota bacterium]
TKGIVVGEGGVILYTINGGLTWTESRNASGDRWTTKNLYGIDYINGTTVAFAVGAGGVVLRSDDGGQTWVSQPSGTSADLYAVSFVNKGFQPAILASTPGQGGTPDGSQTGTFAGWAVGETAIYTTSGGIPTNPADPQSVGWRDNVFPASMRDRLYWGVDLVRPNTVVMSGENGRIIHGYNGAGGWTFQIKAETGTDLYDVKMILSHETSGALNAGAVSSALRFHWDGSQYPFWVLPDEPNIPAAGTDGLIEGLAVGANGQVMRWTGTQWVALIAANPLLQDLRGVATERYTYSFNVTDQQRATPGPLYNAIQPLPRANENGGRDGMDYLYNAYFTSIAGTDGELRTPGASRGWAEAPFRPINNSAPLENGYTTIAPAGLLLRPPNGSVPRWYNGIPSLLYKAPGTNRDLGTLFGGAGLARAKSVNGEGFIVGVSSPSKASEATAGRAFLSKKRTGSSAWEPMIDLGTLGGQTSTARAIAEGVARVVGTSTAVDGSSRAFLWSNGAMRDLNSLIPSGLGWTLVDATSINDAGEIVGYGVRNGQTRAFMLRPGPAAGFANTPPSVQIAMPTGGQAFVEGRAITLGAMARDIDGVISRVDFYLGDQLIGSSLTPTSGQGGGGSAGLFTISYTPPALNPRQPVTMVLRAVVTDNLDRSTTSESVPFSIVPTGTSWLVTDLGTFGGESSDAYAINNLGQVVGIAQRPDGASRPFVWSLATGLRELPGLAPNRDGHAYDLNDFGLIVGRSMDADGISKPVAWRFTGGVAASPLALTGFSANATGEARSINNLDQITGWGLVTGGYKQAWIQEADGSRIQALGTLGGANSDANGINNSRTVVGTSQRTSGGDRAFRWKPGNPFGSMSDLNPTSNGSAVNYYGDIVGRDSGSNAFFWAEGQNSQALGAGEALSVNDGRDAVQLRVVGYQTVNGNRRATVWAPGTAPVDLTAQLSVGSGWSSLSTARDVNNGGVVVGQGILNGKSRAFLARPVAQVGQLVNVPPVVTLISPTNGQTMTSSTSAASLTLTAIAGDGDGTVNRVDFWVGGLSGNDNLLIGSAETATQTEGGISYFSYPWTSVQPGTYYILAVAVDDHGATSVSNRATVTVSKPSGDEPPTVAISGLSIGGVSQPVSGQQVVQVRSAGRLTLTGTASDAEGPITQVEVFRIDNASATPLTKIGNAVITGSTWTMLDSKTYSGVAETFTYIAVAYDSAGTRLSSDPVVVLFNPPTSGEVQLPTLLIRRPTANQGFLTGQTITVEIDTSNLGGINLDSVEFFLTDGTSSTDALKQPGVPAGFTSIGFDGVGSDGYTQILGNLPPGFYSIAARAPVLGDASRVLVSQVRSFRVDPGRLRIISESSRPSGVIYSPDYVWEYVVRSQVDGGLGGSERVEYAVEDPDDAVSDSEMSRIQVIPDPDDRTAARIVWSPIGIATDPGTGARVAHVRLRIRARLNDGLSTTTDPIDVQDVVLYVPTTAGSN